MRRATVHSLSATGSDARGLPAVGSHRRRREKTLFSLWAATYLAAAPIVVAAPNLVDGKGLLIVGGALALPLYIFVLSGYARVRISLLSIATVGMALLWSVCLLRGWSHGTVSFKSCLAQMLVWVGFTGSALILIAKLGDREFVIWACVLAPVVFVAVSVLLGLAGIPVSTGAPDAAEMLGYLGVGAERGTFPLSPGSNYNVFGTLAGAALVALFAIFMRRGEAPRRVRHLLPVACALAAWGLLKADSRGALVAGVVASFLAVLAIYPWARKLLPIVALLPAVSAPAALAGADLAGRLFSGADAATATRGSISSASNRDLIWRPVMSLINQPGAHALIGYGAYGQVTSGASTGYSSSLVNAAADVDPRYASSHNAGLQMRLDAGVLGLIAYMAWTCLMLRQFLRGPKIRIIDQIGVAGVLYWLIVGVTEASPSIYFSSALACLTGLAVVASRPRLDLENPAVHRARPRHRQLFA